MEALSDVVIVIHLMVIVALIGVVLIQRSEGGALGIGGSNNFLTGRGQGNVLTRATGILAAAFFATSLALTVIAQLQPAPSSILNVAPTTTTAPLEAPATGDAPATTTAPATGGTGGILDELNTFTGGSGASGTTTTTPAEPATPAAPAEPQVPTTE